MILAAVAGLAALAVTFVADVVDETGDQLANPDPRLTAAQIAADEVVHDAASSRQDRFGTWGDWAQHFRQRCAQLEILYVDAGAEVTTNIFQPATDDDLTDHFDAVVARAAHADPPVRGVPQAACEIG